MWAHPLHLGCLILHSTTTSSYQEKNSAASKAQPLQQIVMNLRFPSQPLPLVFVPRGVFRFGWRSTPTSSCSNQEACDARWNVWVVYRQVFLKLIPGKLVCILWLEGCLQPTCLLLRTPDWCAHIPESQKHYSPDSLRDGFGRCKSRGGWVNSTACGCHILFTESLGIFFGDDSRKPLVFN